MKPKNSLFLNILDTHNTKYSTYAFISYSHRDMSVAKWLQRKLEGFKLPTKVKNNITTNSKYIRPVFRDQSDLNTGILTEELHRHLVESKFLIVICSKHSAQSHWVSEEAKTFVEMGRLDCIIPIIIPDGETPERELFPIFLRDFFEQNPTKELLGIEYKTSEREKALVRVVSRMLNVSFDTLWQRHQRQKKLRIISVTTSSAVLLTALYLFALPVSLKIDITPEIANLPSEEHISLRVNDGKYLVNITNPHIEDIKLPGYNRFNKISISVSSPYFSKIDTSISTGLTPIRHITIPLIRDNTFAIFSGEIFDENLNPIEGVTVTVAGQIGITNSEGVFNISLPLHTQREQHSITLEKDGYHTFTRRDESPGHNLKYILHKKQ